MLETGKLQSIDCLWYCGSDERALAQRLGRGVRGQPFRIGDFLEVTTPPAGWRPWAAARAHWGRGGGLLGASLRTTALNATCGGLSVAGTVHLGALRSKDP